MSNVARAMYLDGQLNSQKALLKQAKKEGNQIAAKRAEKNIKEIEKELKDIT